MHPLPRLVGVLTAICIGAAVALALVYSATKEPIAEQKLQKLLRSLRSVLPPFDNEIDRDTKELDLGVDARGNPVKKTLYFAKQEGKPVGTAFQMTAPDGYSGDIVILMGVDPEGKITGIEIVSHKETPGLGDKIVKESWRNQFKGKSLTIGRLDVKKDGGEIDQFSGATISPRAVVKAVKEGLKLYAKEFPDGRR